MTEEYPRTIENGAGERLTFRGVRTGVDGHQYLDIENQVAPGSGPPMHIHHLQRETMTVEQGRAGYRIAGGPELFAEAGEIVTFEAGQMHRFWNAGEGVLRCKGWASPPHNLEYFLTELFASMRRNGGGRPNRSDAAYLLGRYRTEFGLGGVPPPVRRLVFPALRQVGTAIGRYHRFANAPAPIADSSVR
jgi:mannose-6-phosphate isomerase-like protein (cupin superfamily)